ncbi:hypothetical protein MNV49_006248 [Pseudohyphozyma bogoriensis]|nr:hypothetical protein MNV49_006248 [Pseudohyphozyma bogoriensis]
MTPRSLLLALVLLAPSAFAQEIPAEPVEHGLQARALFDGVYDDPLDNLANSWHHREKRALGVAWTHHATTISSAGTSGVGAMQVSVVDDDHILIFDKSENNPLKVKGHAAWGSIYTISTHKVRALNLNTNSFCAGGGWLSNGTLVSVGGNPREGLYKNDKANNGLAAIRFFTPCTNDKCDVYENPSRIHLTTPRWYASTVRLTDGSIMILGGMTAGGFNNARATDNPTFEFFPPKGDGLEFYSKNLFPITFLLPDGHVFVVANHIAMLYNWKTNTEHRLPSLPNGVRVNYPDTAASVLLPLTVKNKWTPEVLICGGSTANSDGNPWDLRASQPASRQCLRMVLTTAGIKKGWKTESMPEARVMGDAILTPDGKVLIVNGAKTGIAGYGNVPDVVGASNAKNPAYKPVLYDPLGSAGKRFTTNFPSSKIERLYHSSATLIPDGRIFISGSNPNGGVSTKTYKTRYEVEMLNLYGKQYTLGIKLPSGTKVVTAVIMDLGYSTHSVHMNNRLVELQVKRNGAELTIQGPKTVRFLFFTGIYPPGYAWLYVLADGIPSKGKRVMIGSGASPPVSTAAIKNLLKKRGSGLS